MPFQHPPTEGLPCPLAGFASSHDSFEHPGINLVYVVDKHTAGAGEKLLFTAWILNSSEEILTGVNLHLRSFTNSILEPVRYATQPTSFAMTNRVLGPRRSISFTFSYVITPEDAVHTGQLISALQVSLTSPSQGRLHSECDAMVTMALAA